MADKLFDSKFKSIDLVYWALVVVAFLFGVAVTYSYYN